MWTTGRELRSDEQVQQMGWKVETGTNLGMARHSMASKDLLRSGTLLEAHTSHTAA